MLKLMGGFEVGKGVGKRNQGITAPVEAVTNKKNACLGEGVFEERKPPVPVAQTETHEV